MEFLELRLSTQNLAHQRAFYTEALELRLLEETAEYFAVKAGSSLLRFNLSEGKAGPYHLAFNIPENKLSEAKAWLLERVELLEEDGQNQFSSESWNAEQVYFLDADGNILESIARHELQHTSYSSFGSRHILNVSEIGYVVPDVPKTVEALSNLGLTPYHESGQTFSAVGDAHGLLIIAETARPWFPTEIKAGIAPLELTFSSAAPFDYTEPGLPYHLRSVLGSVLENQ